MDIKDKVKLVFEVENHKTDIKEFTSLFYNKVCEIFKTNKELADTGILYGNNQLKVGLRSYQYPFFHAYCNCWSDIGDIEIISYSVDFFHIDGITWDRSSAYSFIIPYDQSTWSKYITDNIQKEMESIKSAVKKYEQEKLEKDREEYERLKKQFEN